MILSREQKLQIERHFFAMDDDSAELEELQNRIEEPPPLLDGMPRGSGVSDPVGRIVAQRDEKIRDLQSWLYVTTRTFDRYRHTELGSLMTMRYIEKQEREVIEEALHISQQRFYDWRTEILIYAAIIASNLGILKIV